MDRQYCKLIYYPLIYRDYFTGDIDDINILIGCYSLGDNTTFIHNSFPINFLPWYGLFIQFNSFNIQLIISAGSGQIGIRRRVGNPRQWESWKIFNN